MIFIERDSRDWSVAQAGVKDTALFTEAAQLAWRWANLSAFIRWFTDGERRYAQQRWRLASVYPKSSQVSREYGHRKVWREGLEVAIEVKGSHGHRRVEWVKPEHPYTAISPAYEAHAHPVEANNSALRRCGSAYRRRQNLYAKMLNGLQRTVTVQRLVHNWLRPYDRLDKNTTPAMALGLYHRPISMLELLSLRGPQNLTN